MPVRLTTCKFGSAAKTSGVNVPYEVTMASASAALRMISCGLGSLKRGDFDARGACHGELEIVALEIGVGDNDFRLLWLLRNVWSGQEQMQLLQKAASLADMSERARL